MHHTFVLQQDSSHTLYGIALRVWSRADEKRAETIRELRKRHEPDYYGTDDETYWIPYALSFLSRYPLFNLLGDYLRGMWIHWNKATNLFHAEYVLCNHSYDGADSWQRGFADSKLSCTQAQ